MNYLPEAVGIFELHLMKGTEVFYATNKNIVKKFKIHYELNLKKIESEYIYQCKKWATGDDIHYQLKEDTVEFIPTKTEALDLIFEEIEKLNRRYKIRMEVSI